MKHGVNTDSEMKCHELKPRSQGSYQPMFAVSIPAIGTTGPDTSLFLGFAIGLRKRTGAPGWCWWTAKNSRSEGLFPFHDEAIRVESAFGFRISHRAGIGIRPWW
jgi:hypothetical protein